MRPLRCLFGFHHWIHPYNVVLRREGWDDIEWKPWRCERCGKPMDEVDG